MHNPDAYPATRLIVSPRARRDVRKAYLWYRKDSPHAATKFQAALREAFLLVAEAPLRWAEVAPGVRRFLLPHHPYTFTYSVKDAHVKVLAVFHQARGPDTWRGHP